MPYRRSSYVRTSQTGTFSIKGNGTLVKRKIVETVTPPPPPPCQSPNLHVEGEDGWTYDGCNWTQGTGGCPEGEFWNGFNCTGDAEGGCPEGYYWDGSICQPNEDPPPEE